MSTSTWLPVADSDEDFVPRYKSAIWVTWDMHPTHGEEKGSLRIEHRFKLNACDSSTKALRDIFWGISIEFYTIYIDFDFSDVSFS